MPVGHRISEATVRRILRARRHRPAPRNVVGADYSSVLVSGMPILVEGAAESVPSADVEVRDPLRIGNRFG